MHRFSKVHSPNNNNSCVSPTYNKMGLQIISKLSLRSLTVDVRYLLAVVGGKSHEPDVAVLEVELVEDGSLAGIG